LIAPTGAERFCNRDRDGNVGDFVLTGFVNQGDCVFCVITYVSFGELISGLIGAKIGLLDIRLCGINLSISNSAILGASCH
jgi:hypothetical protein